MIIRIKGHEYICDSAKRTENSIILTKTNAEGIKITSSYSGGNILQTAEIIEGEWEYDALIEPTQADRIEAQATYTAMMTDTLLEV